jgi:DNA-binding helix-hairpin-helix protein with protein kinase domain
MGQDLTQQWLAEIHALKQQVAELLEERHLGWKSAEKWQKLYNTEAEQRRADAQMSKQEIALLKAEIQKLKGIEGVDISETTAIEQEVSLLNSVNELKAKLITVMKERDRLLSLLKTEQDNHAQTRKSLTTALGDAIDGLTKKGSGGVRGHGGQGGQGGQGKGDKGDKGAEEDTL